ncbi:beta-galactosidase [Nonomuraea sp. NPDC049400]|uniref:beta-galactosidase n=1 Tax=Nonomuraea sp. NPDC049400 TaxID=3364352 RepID=UPI0037A94CEB
MGRHSLQHVVRGAVEAVSFQWRASRGGAEQRHQGMAPHTGADSRIFREVCETGRVLAALPAAAGPVEAGLRSSGTTRPRGRCRLPGFPLPNSTSGLNESEAENVICGP